VVSWYLDSEECDEECATTLECEEVCVEEWYTVPVEEAEDDVVVLAALAEWPEP
jgi:hypothetical protein